MKEKNTLIIYIAIIVLFCIIFGIMIGYFLSPSKKTGEIKEITKSLEKIIQKK